MQIVKSYDAKLDSKKRITLRNVYYDYYHVEEFGDRNDVRQLFYIIGHNFIFHFPNNPSRRLADEQTTRFFLYCHQIIFLFFALFHLV